MAASIHLIRHGQAAFGAADYDELSALGRQQSCLLGAALAPLWRDGDRIIVGGMRRHRQTAEECLAAMPSAREGHGEATHTDPRWNEFDHREIVARHRPEYLDHQRLVADLGAAADPRRAFQSLFAAAMTRWSSGEHDHDYSETWAAFRQRCRVALQAAADAAAGSANVWVFTSGGPIAAVVQGLLDAPDAQALRLSWSLVNASVTQLHVARSGLRLSTFNGHAHLQAREDLVTYR
ncbi:histidine phosphatase family protein [Lysobacter sp. CA196]|uniref:histidine phosphatase family protein n=1 Tax=Lysobacter sp. CA196 TaxID=3455606 RepID=UPI003F8D8DD7